MEKVELIQEQLWIAQSKPICCANKKVCDVAFMDGEKVLMNVLPLKSVMWFRKKGELSPRVIGLFEVLEKWLIGFLCLQTYRGYTQYFMFMCYRRGALV